MNKEALTKLVMKDNDTVVLEKSRTKGPLGETEIDTYIVLNSAGEKIGSVIHTDHTAIKGFARTQTIEQYGLAGELLVRTSW